MAKGKVITFPSRFQGIQWVSVFFALRASMQMFVRSQKEADLPTVVRMFLD
jgi:hypothetical protein